jgi:hypothetical protein
MDDWICQEVTGTPPNDDLIVGYCVGVSTQILFGNHETHSQQELRSQLDVSKLYESYPDEVPSLFLHSLAFDSIVQTPARDLYEKSCFLATPSFRPFHSLFMIHIFQIDLLIADSGPKRQNCNTFNCKITSICNATVANAVDFMQIAID